MMPILDAMVKEQDEQGVSWTPSKIIHRRGARFTLTSPHTAGARHSRVTPQRRSDSAA